MKKIRAVLLIFLTPLFCISGVLCVSTAFGERHFDFTAGCRDAYGAIVRLQLESGRQMLDAEKRRDPDNLIPAFLENYIDFFVLFFNEDPAEYRLRKDNLDRRIALMSEGPESSPYYLFTKAVIHFQWAAVKIKFGDHWDAGWEFRRSFLQAGENQRKFPGFSPNGMLSSAMQVVAGTIPDGYKWLSRLLGIRGDIVAGMRSLSGFLQLSDADAALYHNEAIFYYLYLKFYIENRRSEVFDYIRQNKLDVENNYLFAYLASNLAINDQRSDYAQRVIRQRSVTPGYLDMPVWDLAMGYARASHLDSDAHEYLERFLRRFRGAFYIKDALQKLSWLSYLQGDTVLAASYRAMILRKGGSESDADKQAVQEAKNGGWPDKSLLKARLLCDGGYYREALEALREKSPASFPRPAERVELNYRLGRIYDGLGRDDEALVAYAASFEAGKSMMVHYAARAALQTGYLYEKRQDCRRAVEWFRRCLALRDHDYKNSLDQKAKAGVERCGG